MMRRGIDSDSPAITARYKIPLEAEFFLAKLRVELGEEQLPLAEAQTLLKKFADANGVEHPHYLKLELMLNAF